uniref:Phospholipase-like protein n=1 Tax=Tanacetum cinerariifolium TaxID=118510 RepID=A0A6L2KFT5_TANCI|nr:phospholipase-like protein [Tanacetum cinerariifolium]
MTDSIQLYDVKVVVRSALKLLQEIKRLLSSNPNYLNLFRRTVFGPWLDLPSHYNDNHLMHYVLQHQDSIPIVNLDPTPAEKIQAWFDLSIPYFNGIVDEDGKGCGDDCVLVSKDNFVDEDCNVCEDTSAGLSKDEIVNDKLVDGDCNVWDDAFAGLSKDNVVNEKSVGNNDQLLLEDGDGLFDSEAGCRNSEEDNENQPTNVSICDLYAVIKVHEERIANLEKLLKEKPPNDYAAENIKPNMIPSHFDDIPSCSIPNLNSNQTGVDQELGGAANDLMICMMAKSVVMQDVCVTSSTLKDKLEKGGDVLFLEA